MRKKIKVMHMIWSMGDGGAQQVIINYLRDFHDDLDIEFKLYVYTKPTDSKYDREIAEKGYNVVYLNNPRTRVQIPYIKRFFQRPVSQKVWEKAISEYNPDIVHVHISALLGATMPEKWCKALLNDSSENIPIATIADYEVHNMSKKMKEIYLKYYSMYEENQNADTK